jgi:DNA repair protein RecO (recombination protein O)
MEWQEPATVLEIIPYGEGDALVTLLAAEHGLWRGLVKGGKARGKSATWQTGNLITARWTARQAENLGQFTGELVYPAAALAMQDQLNLAVLTAACALTAGALPEREPHPAIFTSLARLLAAINVEALALPTLIKWELDLLRDLGFGLNLTSPAIAGDNDRPAFVSPRTGRSVSLSAAGEWADRLLQLPHFLIEDSQPTQADCLTGLKLTGHFLTRDVFGARHRPLPPARERLYDLLLERQGD